MKVGFVFVFVFFLQITSLYASNAAILLSASSLTRSAAARTLSLLLRFPLFDGEAEEGGGGGGSSGAARTSLAAALLAAPAEPQTLSVAAPPPRRAL